MKKILIRVDMSDKIGGGHLMRMIGLAELLSDHGYEIHFASMSYGKDHMISSLLDGSFQLHLFNEPAGFDPRSDLQNLMTLARQLQPKWIVLDGYHFPVEYEKRIRTAGFSSMRVDDLPVQPCETDIFLNHNHGSASFGHDVSPVTTQLLGLQHLLLRRDFRKLDTSGKKIAEPGSMRLLVSLGGGSAITDALNRKILEALRGIKGLIGEATVIIGKMGMMSEDLSSIAGEADFPVNVIQHSENMAGEMLKADIAITAGGYSMWELLYTKTPYMSIALNPAQEKYIAFLVREGLCTSLENPENTSVADIQKGLLALIKDRPARVSMIERAEHLLDRSNNGKGLVEALKN